MILLIDNYDSFVYNLARYVSELGIETVVKRNDSIKSHDINLLQPTHIIISPGPCTPNEAGISLEIMTQLGKDIPILGVCLGHQCIAQAFGGTIKKAKRPMHGKSSPIIHQQSHLFTDIPSPLHVGRYHSLIVSDDNLPATLQVTARCDQNEIMALQHVVWPIYGVQFHPESILTQEGHQILRNFLG